MRFYFVLYCRSVVVGRTESIVYALHLLRGEQATAKRMYESEFVGGVANPPAESVNVNTVFCCKLLEGFGHTMLIFGLKQFFRCSEAV